MDSKWKIIYSKSLYRNYQSFKQLMHLELIELNSRFKSAPLQHKFTA
jgi:hypothetical protein